MAEVAEKNESSTIYDYPGKTKSTVWRFFGFSKLREGPPTKENLDMRTVICKLCLKSYANKGNTTNLQQHLDKHHGDCDSSQSTKQEPKKRLVQPHINVPVPVHKPFSGDKKKKIDDLTLKLIVGKVLPLSLVDNHHFKALLKELDPRYVLPSRYDISRILKQKEDHMKEKLRHDLPPENGFIAITHDGWTSCATESYDTITAHFINNDWELHSAVLQTCKVEGSHTAQNIAGRLQEAVSHWKIPTPTVVTDNAANERKAVQLLGWERFGCYGHRINLIVKHALEIPEVSKIIGKTRKLVTLFHQSTSLNDCLLQKQSTVFSNIPSFIGHKLIHDVPTRWNSCYDMLQRVNEQTPAILAVASDDQISKNASTGVKTYCLTFEEQNTVEGLMEVLLPFKMATTILCAENSPTMSKVLVCMAKIHKTLDSPSFSPTVLKVVSVMKEEISKRTEHEEASVLGAVLNPDLKSLHFMSPEDQSSAHRLLLQKAADLIDVNGNLNVKIKKEREVDVAEASECSVLPKLPSLPGIEDHESNIQISSEHKSDDEPVAKKIKCSDLEEWFDDVFVTGESAIPITSLIEQEVSRYLASSREREDCNLSLLEWWKKNENVYPRLSVLARKYLAIPASSVPSERVFSLAGNLVSKKRSRLRPDMVNTLVFMKMNMDLYW